MEDDTLFLRPNDGVAPEAPLTPAQWREIDQILDAVLEVPVEARDEYLTQLCGDSGRIREQVEVLLAAGEDAAESTFLRPLSGGAEGAMLRSMAENIPVEQLKAGQKVGSYAIIRSIGRGGMGVVYLAERSYGQFKKQVALKVVKRGMDTDDILRRFQFERQLLASLEHANIARLLDGGITDDGLPFFVMEYVPGEPIDKYCDSRKLPIKERLKLFKTVCEAVQYAHRNLVVHRDLKPGNVLVTEEGEVKLLDFGIAKMLDNEAPMGTLPMTDAESRRMTPEYAAPEQVRGEGVTTATDVYALGVILYELLTGRRPYRFKTRLYSEIEEKICQKVPGRPSTAAVRTIPDARLDVLEVSDRRSTAPDRLRRQLSGDLDAIAMKALKKEPELRYISAGEMASDVERHQEMRPVRAQRDSLQYRAGKFVRRYKFTVAAAAIAFFALIGGILGTAWQAREANLALAQMNEERQIQEAVQAFTTDFIRGINPKTTEEYELARSLMERGFERMNMLNDRPLIKARVMNASGEIARGFSLYDMADSLHNEARKIQLEAGLPANHPDIVESINGVGRIFQARRDWDRAEEIFREAMDLNPGVYMSYNNLGAIKLMKGKVDEAIELFEHVVDKDPENVKATNNLGVVHFYLQHWEEAMIWFERALSLEPSYQIYINLGNLYYYHEGRYEDAAKNYEKALELNDKDFSVWGSLANAFLRVQGEEQRATETFQIAIQKAEKSLRQVSDEDADILSDLATYHAVLGHRNESISNILKALELAPKDATVMMRTGYVHEQIGEYDIALEWTIRAIEAGYPLSNIEREPGFARLRTDPRYTAFVESLAADE